MFDLTTAKARVLALALMAAVASAQAGCAAMTATFELTGTQWSDGGSWSEVKAISPEGAPVGAVLVEPGIPKLTCYRTPNAKITSFSARYTVMYKILAGFMLVSEGAFTALLLGSKDAPTGARVAGVVIGVDALATLGLMIFTRTKIESREAPPPQYTVVATCPPDAGIQIGDRFLAVDEHGSFRDADASDALVADAPRQLRVAGRTVPVPLTESERAGRSPVLVVLERPSFVVPWPVEIAPPPPPGAAGTTTTVATQVAP